MKNIRTSLLMFCLMMILSSAEAQRGNNELKVSGQLSLPAGNLASLVKAGQGYSVKALWGLGKLPQQISLEVNNNFWDVKNKYVAQNISSYYSSWPIYFGYRRYYFKYFYTENQAGVAFNQFVAFRADSINASVQQSKTFLAFSSGLGYHYEFFDVGVRYQNSPVKNNANISFWGFRVAFCLPIFKQKIITGTQSIK